MGTSLGTHKDWALPAPPSAMLPVGTQQVIVIGIRKLEGEWASDGEGWERVRPGQKIG